MYNYVDKYKLRYQPHNIAPVKGSGSRKCNMGFGALKRRPVSDLVLFLRGSRKGVY